VQSCISNCASSPGTILINETAEIVGMSSGEDAFSDEAELGRLLRIVSDKGLKALDLVEMDRLRALLRAKQYADKKANKSKAKLLKQINLAFYDSHSPRRWI
jgi:hypothetical protein